MPSKHPFREMDLTQSSSLSPGFKWFNIIIFMSFHIQLWWRIIISRTFFFILVLKRGLWLHTYTHVCTGSLYAYVNELPWWSELTGYACIILFCLLVSASTYFSSSGWLKWPCRMLWCVPKTVKNVALSTLMCGYHTLVLKSKKSHYRQITILLM